MRTAIGSTWLYMIIIIFTFIFAGFLTLTLKYSKVYKIKNEVLAIVEKYEGFTEKSYDKNGKANQYGGSINIINDYLFNSGYTATGYCESGTYAPPNLSTPELYKTKNNTKYPYCVTKHEHENTNTVSFSVVFFLKLDIPILRELANFQISGTTYDLEYSTFKVH